VRPDYDLSGLEPFQADLWVFFQTEVIRAEIHADQAKRQGFGWCEGIKLEELCGLLLQPVSPTALPLSPALRCPSIASRYMH